MYAQFFTSTSGTTQAGDPNVGPPNGYGMMQLEFNSPGSVKYSVADIWNWRTNVADAIKLFDVNASGGNYLGSVNSNGTPPYTWIGQVNQWQQFVSGGATAPEPMDIFQYPVSTPQVTWTFRVMNPVTGQPLTTPLNAVNNGSNTYSYRDANIMKANGGGSRYMMWNNSTFKWVEHVVSNNGQQHNFPYEFTTCASPEATCQHSTPAPLYLTPQ